MKITFFLFALLFPFSTVAQTFDQWLEQANLAAQAKGVDTATIQNAQPLVEFLPDVITLDRKQPEAKKTFREYLHLSLPNKRVDDARERFAANHQVLSQISKRYGVPGSVIVALWGKESDFGRYMGNYNVLSSLATLGYEGRRAEFFRQEYINALIMLQQPDGLGPDDLQGSWAGAMGQCQFMPSSFLKFAVDEDGDGRRDIWQSEAVVFASIANYLSSSGWQPHEPMMLRVRAPQTLLARGNDLKIVKPISAWVALGVRPIGPIPAGLSDVSHASLVAPSNDPGYAYLIFQNYRVVMQWNRSVYFATTVGILADILEKP